MAIAQDPFTLTTLSTIGGATPACTVVPNVLGRVVEIPGRVRAGIALVLALVIEVVVAASSQGNHGLGVWVVAVLNGFLVAAAALGLNETNASGSPPAAAIPSPAGSGALPDDRPVKPLRISWL